jgi:two-component system, chemotaxis family, protein-glutamate methylesterase/glutaminase
VAQKRVRVLLVDDSPLALVILQRMLSKSPEIEVVGVATHGRQALELIPHLKPAVICTDFHMPDMNGLELTQEIMARYPCPILVISSAVGESDSDRIFNLLQAGAVDVFPKPRGGPDADTLAAEQLVKKIRIVAGVRVHGRRPKSAGPKGPRVPTLGPKTGNRLPKIIVIGSSTGGPQALQTILSDLPPHFPVPIICVQHISLGFLPGLVKWLAGHFRGEVQIARPNETPRPGHVYFPQENTHLVIDDQGRLQPSTRDPIGGHRPSVSASFCSVAEQFGDEAVGVLLTGMGSDGGDGMLAMAQAGALTICQNEATCVVYGMPKDAIARGAARVVLPLNDIARALVKAVSPVPISLGEKLQHGK